MFCPFNNLNDNAISRRKEHLQKVGDALLLEQVSLALNPRATRYRDCSLIQITIDSENQPALDAYRERLAGKPWVVYRVRRIYSRKAKADRAVERVAVYPTATEAMQYLNVISASRAIQMEELPGIKYVFLEKRSETVFPCREEYFVVAPAIVDKKARYGLGWFEKNSRRNGPRFKWNWRFDRCPRLVAWAHGMLAADALTRTKGLGAAEQQLRGARHLITCRVRTV
jgi:hypothetical protein